MTTGRAPICMWYKRYRSASRIGELPTCDAFPSGIPDEILEDGSDHRKPIKGDNGIRFEARDEIPMEWDPS